MTDTSQLKLPLLQPAQAQKHVTVNEALVRLDGLAQLVMQSRSLTIPPPTAAAGTGSVGCTARRPEGGTGSMARRATAVQEMERLEGMPSPMRRPLPSRL